MHDIGKIHSLLPIKRSYKKLLRECHDFFSGENDPAGTGLQSKNHTFFILSSPFLRLLI